MRLLHLAHSWSIRTHIQYQANLSINSPGGPSGAFLQEMLTIGGPPSKEKQAELYEKYKIRLVESSTGFDPFAAEP
jgi:hypothetical protein